MTLPIRICIITSSNIFENSIGGEARYAILLHRWLNNNNIKSDLLGNQLFRVRSYGSRDDNNTLNTNKTLAIRNPFLRFYPIFMVYRLVVSFLMSLTIFRMHRKNPFALIHSQDTGYAGLTAILVGKFLGIPAVISSHGIRHKTIQQSLNSRLKKIILRLEKNLDIFNIKMADEVLADNQTINDYLEDLVKKKMRIMPIPIDLKVFKYSLDNRESIRKEFDIGKMTKTIGYVGRFAPEKNLLTLLAAFAEISKKYSEVKLLLIGNGIMYSDLKNKVDVMKISNKVIFCGVRQDIDRILSGIDIFVLPSFVEGMSIALLEAMATGCAIICSKISTNEELITDKMEGILVDPTSTDDFIVALSKLLEDDLLRESLKNKAVIKASDYGINAIFEKVWSFYQETIEKHSNHESNRNIQSDK